MGGFLSKFFGSKTEQTSDIAPAEPKVYSWDKRSDEDFSDLQFIDVRNEILIKGPATIGGKPFTLRNLSDCRVFLFDNIATINVDNCVNCVIFIGPTEQSVFLRNCKECNVIVCCQQFRMRSCHKINILLHCATQPIIETSFKIKFACFHFFYGQLLSQMKAAGLSPFMNCWYNIHDFSPNTEDDGKPNHGYLSSSQIQETLSLFDLTAMENLPDNFDRNSLQFDSSRNVAPSTREHLARKTSGGDTVSDISHQEPLKQDPGIVSLLVSIPFENRDERLTELIEKVKQTGQKESSEIPKWGLFDCLESPLITQEELTRVLFSNSSNDMSMTSVAGDEQKVTTSDNSSTFVNKIKSKGKVIALAFSCNDSESVEEMTQMISDQISPFKDYIHISARASAKKQFDNLQRYVQMQCN